MKATLFLIALLAATIAKAEEPNMMALAASLLKVHATATNGATHVGSGVQIAPGKVVTNCHVTRHAAQIGVLRGSQGQNVSAQAAHVGRDVCLLHLPAPVGFVAEVGRAADLRRGDTVYALGFPGGHSFRASGGKVTALFPHDGGWVIQTDAAFNLGASGGGLFNAQGKLVGILTFFKHGPGGSFFFAAPIEWAVEQLEATPDGVKPLDGSAYWAGTVEKLPYFLQATSMVADGDFGGHRRIAVLWSEHEPKNPEAWRALSLAHQRQGNDREAGRLTAFASRLPNAH